MELLNIFNHANRKLGRQQTALANAVYAAAANTIGCIRKTERMHGGETMEPIAVKRIYAEPDDADGRRILADRIWPRGMTKEKAQLTVWMKEIAPSASLRIVRPSAGPIRRLSGPLRGRAVGRRGAF